MQQYLSSSKAVLTMLFLEMFTRNCFHDNYAGQQMSCCWRSSQSVAKQITGAPRSPRAVCHCF